MGEGTVCIECLPVFIIYMFPVFIIPPKIPKFLFGISPKFPYLYRMKTKSIIYKNFVPQVETTPVITQDEVPIFKYTGYKPRYK